MASSPGDTLSIVARVSSNPPASPEDNTKELMELSCIQGWVYSLPRDDVLCSEATEQGWQGPQGGRWPQVQSATAWPEQQQQLVALAPLNLRECDADEYERGDVTVTAGAAGGAAPAPPSCPLLATFCPLQQQFVFSPLGTGIRDWDQASKFITLVQKPGLSPGGSRSGRVRE